MGLVTGEWKVLSSSVVRWKYQGKRRTAQASGSASWLLEVEPQMMYRHYLNRRCLLTLSPFFLVDAGPHFALTHPPATAIPEVLSIDFAIQKSHRMQNPAFRWGLFHLAFLPMEFDTCISSVPRHTISTSQSPGRSSWSQLTDDVPFHYHHVVLQWPGGHETLGT